MSDRPETRMIGLAGIAIFPDRMRALHPEVVADLAQSIKEIGLLNPITITPRDGIGYRLLAGRHRYEAVKKLGLESIEARIRANRECDPASYPRNLGCFDKAVR